MKYMTINNRRVAFDTEKNILMVLRHNGINLPTFCYHSELSTYGACRMCVVEDDRGRILASCSEVPRDGMKLYTNTPRLQKYRKMILELLLSSHCRDCTTCRKSGDCTLQDLAHQLGVVTVRFEDTRPAVPIDESSDSIVVDHNKCILCGDCVRTCDELQGLGILNFINRGAETRVGPAFNRIMSATECVGCGQCAAVCPTGAITVKQNIRPVWEALSDQNTRVIAQIAPAVRVAVGDMFGLPHGQNSLGVLVAALRRLGFDAIYDTNFGADLTVTEEGNELVERLKTRENLPLFTSCCPGWVKFCEEKYPALTSHISTCRSPQSMFGAVLKEEARMKRASGEDKRKTVVISIMPCTAKKGEILRPEHYDDGEPVVDFVLTTTEITRMIREAGIDLADLSPEALDMPFGIASGGASIFGVTGGVTEAVLRNLIGKSDLQTLRDIKFTGIRGTDQGIKEATVRLGDQDVRIAVCHGLANADKLMSQIQRGEVYYDFVEVMACRRGCIQGGGQPPVRHADTREARYEGMYNIDRASQVKISKENPLVQALYANPVLKGKEHKLLHNEAHK